MNAKWTNSATHYNTLQYTATNNSTLHHAAAHHTTLQHTATHCNTLQHIATHSIHMDQVPEKEKEAKIIFVQPVCFETNCEHTHKSARAFHKKWVHESM